MPLFALTGWGLLIALLVFIIITGAVNTPWWVSGREYRELLALLRQAQGTAKTSVATSRDAANILESQSSLFRDRAYLAALRQRIGTTLNEDDLQNICFDLGVDYENLSGTTLTGKIRELLESLGKQNRVSELVVLLARDRPMIDWTRIETLT